MTTPKEKGLQMFGASLGSHEYDHSRSLTEFNEWLDQALSAALDVAISETVETERKRAISLIRNWSLTKAERLGDIGICDQLIELIDLPGTQ